MIRPATRSDAAAVIDLAVAAGLFAADDTALLTKTLAAYFDGADDGQRCVIDEGERLGVAYYAPAPATSGTWYLTMIAVRPDRHGRGRGAALLRHVERALQVAGTRALLVETSGAAAYARTRGFYAKCGYESEARIRDFYAAGEDLVVFRKALNAG